GPAVSCFGVTKLGGRRGDSACAVPTRVASACRFVRWELLPPCLWPPGAGRSPSSPGWPRPAPAPAHPRPDPRRPRPLAVVEQARSPSLVLLPRLQPRRAPPFWMCLARWPGPAARTLDLDVHLRGAWFSEYIPQPTRSSG
ncbi:Protein transport protein SEC31, partial [Frankliniella fusca]